MCDGGGIDSSKLRNTTTWSVTFAIELGVGGSHTLGVGRKYCVPIFSYLFIPGLFGWKIADFLRYTNGVEIYLRPTIALQSETHSNIHVSFISYFRFYTNLERRRLQQTKRRGRLTDTMNVRRLCIKCDVIYNIMYGITTSIPRQTSM